MISPKENKISYL